MLDCNFLYPTNHPFIPMLSGAQQSWDHLTQRVRTEVGEGPFFFPTGLVTRTLAQLEMEWYWDNGLRIGRKLFGSRISLNKGRGIRYTLGLELCEAGLNI